MYYLGISKLMLSKFVFVLFHVHMPNVISLISPSIIPLYMSHLHHDSETDETKPPHWKLAAVIAVSAAVATTTTTTTTTPSKPT
jgi:hypothetical protein